MHIVSQVPEDYMLLPGKQIRKRLIKGSSPMCPSKNIGAAFLRAAKLPLYRPSYPSSRTMSAQESVLYHKHHDLWKKRLAHKHAPRRALDGREYASHLSQLNDTYASAPRYTFDIMDAFGRLFIRGRFIDIGGFVSFYQQIPNMKSQYNDKTQYIFNTCSMTSGNYFRYEEYMGHQHPQCKLRLKQGHRLVRTTTNIHLYDDKILIYNPKAKDMLSQAFAAFENKEALRVLDINPQLHAI